MKLTKAQSVAKLAQWCVENSSETFSAFFRYHAHVNKVEIDIHNDGWRKNNSTSNTFELYLNECEDARVEERADETITELNTLLAESGERNSPEKAAESKAERDAKELAAAKAVIERLEGEQVHLMDLSDNPYFQ